MSQRIRLGMLTPSSNTVLEPVTTSMLADLRETSVHFARFRVTEIALSANALAQFNTPDILAAAELLSHARCQVIAWNGTSSGWLGFETDQLLCQAIERITGSRACTSVLALNEIFEKTGLRHFGLVSPYRDDVQSAIVANYAKAGYGCVAERHLGLQDNFSFSEVSPDEIRQMVREVMRTSPTVRPEAVAIFCTNLCGAPLVAELEQEFGIPIYDTISTVVWKSLRMAGVDTKRIKGWGTLFQNVT